MKARQLEVSERERSHHEQSTIIQVGLCHLNRIGIESDFDMHDPVQEYQAWKLTQKHWRKLKIAGIGWIKSGDFQSRYSLESAVNGYVVHNLSKGEAHSLSWDEEGALSCDCDGYIYSGNCSHVDYALELQAKPVAPKVVPLNTVTPKPVVNGTEILPGIVGTNDQVRALQEIIEFVEGSEKQIHGLIGAAGTGKTLTLQAAISALRARGYEGAIAMTAPTNKAVKVLRNMVSRWGLGIEAQTCAKLLRLKPRLTEGGTQYFSPDMTSQGIANRYDLIIVDEGSMVGSKVDGHKGLWEYLNEFIDLFTKILFVGDYCQLPPVNEPISQVFLSIHNPSWLNEVKRYDGAIAVLADDIRNNLARQTKPRFTTEINEDKTKGIFLLNRGSWISNLIKAFSSESSQLDPNYVRCLVYENWRRKDLNQLIRNGMYGKNAPRFQQGDRLIAEKPYFREDREGFSVSTEMEVTHATTGLDGDWKAWFLSCQLFDTLGTRIAFRVLHEDSFEAFKAQQTKLKAMGQHLAYHANLEYWAWVDHAYCLTVHASQGSTYHQVFVDNKNLMRDKNRSTFQWPDGRSELIWERNQLLYVALTRASHRVFVYE